MIRFSLEEKRNLQTSVKLRPSGFQNFALFLLCLSWTLMEAELLEVKKGQKQISVRPTRCCEGEIAST